MRLSVSQMTTNQPISEVTQVAILLVASCYKNGVKLQPCGPLRLKFDFTSVLPAICIKDQNVLILDTCADRVHQNVLCPISALAFKKRCMSQGFAVFWSNCTKYRTKYLCLNMKLFLELQKNQCI